MALDINDSSTRVTLDLNEPSDDVTAVANPEERCAASIQICQTALNNYRPTFNLAVVGKAEEGKSSLINSLVGKQVCKEGDTTSTTMEMMEHVVQVNGYDLKIFDTQGVFDREDEKEHIFETMQDVNIDLLIVCVSMKVRAQSRDTRDTISLLIKTFGIEIWERAIVVLTMANERAEEITRKAGNTPTPTPYNDVVDEFRKTLRNYLSRGEDEQHRKVPPSVIESIPIIPAGKHDERRVDWRTLPDCEDWLSRFWMQCYERCSPEKKGTFAGMVEDCLLLHGDDGSVETLQQSLERTLMSWHISSPGPFSGPHPGASASPCPDPSALNDYRPTFNLAVVGKAGEGKSAFINSLVGKEVCEVCQVTACTMEVKEAIVEQVNGYDLKIFDTPGFFGGNDKEEDIVVSMQDVNIDLLIVCVSMRYRAQRGDTRETILLLTKAFGIEIWERAIVVLTKANERAEDITRRTGNTPTPTPYKDVVDEFCKTLRDYLSRGEDEQHRKVPPSVIENIPIIPVGIHDKQTVDWRKLPDCEDWLSRFWLQCYERCSPEKQGTFAGMAEDCLWLHGNDGSVETLQ